MSGSEREARRAWARTVRRAAAEAFLAGQPCPFCGSSAEAYSDGDLRPLSDAQAEQRLRRGTTVLVSRRHEDGCAVPEAES